MPEDASFCPACGRQQSPPADEYPKPRPEPSGAGKNLGVGCASVFLILVILAIIGGVLASSDDSGSAQGPAQAAQSTAPPSFEFAFYYVTTNCEDNGADLTLASGDGETSQQTVGLPWYSSQEYRPGRFYYVSAQKKSDDPGCNLTAHIATLSLTDKQTKSFPKTARKAVQYIAEHGMPVRSASATAPYGIADVDWRP